MFFNRSTNRAVAVVGAAAIIGLSLAGCSASAGSSSPAEAKSISLLAAGNDPVSIKEANAFAKGFEKANPKVTVTVDSRPAGTDGDNLIKTKLSTGTMDDVFLYNSGSLFQALNPDKHLQPLTNQPWVSKLTKDFKQAVSTSKGTYGAPFGTSFDGGVLYNKKVYAQLGLKIPTTWNQFISNSEKIKAAGKTAVLVSYGDTWTSQLLVLADFANVSKQDPAWAAAYTLNKRKYATQPGLTGFQDTAEIYQKQLMNADYASLTNVNALKELATGEGVQYPMLTAVVGNVQQSNPGQVNDIGYFAQPTASGHPQATVWEPAAAYIPKSTAGAKLTTAEKLIAFINSPAGCKIQNSSALASGPYAISSCTVPSNAPAVVADEAKYQAAGETGLALEFISPIKGPNLEKILIQVGSGISTASQGAALYDQDVKAQAQQLGLPGWGN